MLRPVNDVLGDTGFRVALATGVVLVASTWLLTRAGRRVPGYAFIAVVAMLVGLRAGEHVPAALVVGVVLLLFGELLSGELLSDKRGSWMFRFGFLVPGAWVLGASLPDGFAVELRTTAVVATAVAAPLVVVTVARAPRLAAVLFAISAVGVYLCVPDTEQAEVLMGALVAAAAMAVDPDLRAAPGIAPLTGVFVWTVAIGGHGRAGSVVGGLACLGVLVLVPVVGWGRTVRSAPWVLALGQLVYVVFVARVAGFRTGAGAAIALALPAAIALGVLVAITARRHRLE
jgi:hypothetical protein